MRYKKSNINNRGNFIASSLMTGANVGLSTDGKFNQQMFYQVDMAQVRKVMTQDDIDQQLYPTHIQGAVMARILYQQKNKDIDELFLMLPRDPYFKRVPVKGQIILCSAHIDMDSKLGGTPQLNQRYYFQILNILNEVNNNAIVGISYLSDNEQEQDIDEQTCGQNFYIDISKKNFKLKQGDVVVSGRYGNGLKFTNVLDESNKKMLPKTILMNNTQGLYDSQNDTFSDVNYNNIGSYISLQQLSSQPQVILELASNRQLLDEYNEFSLIGNTIIQNSGKIVLNAKQSDVEIYAKDNIQVSSNKTVLVQSQKIIFDASKQITFRVGDSEIVMTDKQVTITSLKIIQQGQSILANVQDGVTPGYLKLGICPFSGNPITVGKVNK